MSEFNSYDEYTRPKSRSRAFVTSAVLHVSITAGLCLLPRNEIVLRQLTLDPEHESISYIPTSELPALSNAKGAARGREGDAGGAHLLRDSELIRVSRANKVLPEIVETPELRLPVSHSAVADLLAFAPERQAKLAQQARHVANGSRKPQADAKAPQVASEQHQLVDRLLRTTADPKLPVAPPAPMVVAESKPRTKVEEAAAPNVGPETATGPDLPSRRYREAVVLTPRPGNEMGTRVDDRTGMLAMSKNGGSEPGVGARGNGAGIRSGAGPGSGSSGAGPGSSTVGEGGGESKIARNGATPENGVGGPGKGDGQPIIDGVSIHGGPEPTGGQLFLKSFGPSTPKGGMPLGPRKDPAVMITGTARSGGVLQAYSHQQRGRVYTIYMATGIGTAVVEFSATNGGSREAYDADLSAPEPIEATLPPELGTTPIVVSCLLDRSGRITQVQLLEAMTGDLARKLTTALANWRFRPVLRGDQAVEASMLIGLHLQNIGH